MTANKWLVYMIRTRDGQLYTGITTDIQRRWREHASGKGGARYFRGRTPKAIALLEQHADRSSASKREAQIKMFSKSVKEALVVTQFSATNHVLADYSDLLPECTALHE